MLCRLAGAFRLLFAAHGAKPGAVGTAKQHRGDLEHKLLIEPFIYIQMSFFVQRKVKIRVIQIPLLYRPLRIDRLLPNDRVQTAGALSVHRCVCPQCHPDLVAVRLRFKNSGDRLRDPCPGIIMCR